MGPYAVVDYILTLCRLPHIYHGPYARVDFITQSGTKDMASAVMGTLIYIKPIPMGGLGGRDVFKHATIDTHFFYTVIS
jgi:hypothetical protein